MNSKMFIGPRSQMEANLEKFRQLKAFCDHDLRSSIGVVKGFLEIVRDEAGNLSGETEDFLVRALKGASEALENLDRRVAQTKPDFEVVWWLSKEWPMGQPPELGKHLFIRLENFEDWQTQRQRYRPHHFFIDPTLLGGSEQMDLVFRQTGPFLVAIHWLSDTPPDDSLRKAGNLQSLLPARPEWSDVLAALDKVPMIT